MELIIYVEIKGRTTIIQMPGGENGGMCCKVFILYVKWYKTT